ncbi:Retrovirus-related pol Polyprotein, partial [Phytophthora megakarya]
MNRFKARLVTKGFLQEFGIDYNEIFSPVIRMDVLNYCSLLQLFSTLKSTKWIGDLHGQPEGFKIPGKEHLNLGFLKLIKDRCVFLRTVDNLTCYIAVYVDDLLLIAPTPALVRELKSALKKRFSMSDLGEVKYLLGWSIQRDRKNRTIFIHQHKYGTQVIDRFSDYIPYPIATPAEQNAKLSVSSQPSSEQEKYAMKSIPYRQAIGSVMYLMVGTRPDIAVYMREVSQFLANPDMEQWKAVIRGLKYLSGTI